MTTIVAILTGLHTPELEIMLSIAQKVIDSGDELIVAGCPGARYACSFNIYGISAICAACRSIAQRGIRTIDGNFRYIEVSLISKCDSLDMFSLDEVVSTKKSLKDYCFRDVDVGQAAYSSYLGLSRDLDLEGALARYSLKKLILTSIEYTDWLFSLVGESGCTRIVVYNGRHNQTRPFLRVGQLTRCRVDVMEFSGQDAGCVYPFLGDLPQNIKALEEKINANWDRNEKNYSSLVDNYYNIKKNGGIVNDIKSYVLDQNQGLIPKNFDRSVHNIVIFNSSEDEFASLGGDYDNLIYSSQSEAIERIAQSLNGAEGIQIWLRIHPNLKNVGWSFMQRVYGLKRKFKNLEIVMPTSSVCSYALLEASNVVVSFGSTMGMEACYWGKPSVLVGRCSYENLGSTYNPKSHDELIQILVRRDILPLPKMGAFKFALFWMCGGVSIDYFSGSRRDGFRFKGIALKKHFGHNIKILFGKCLERYILGTVNFLFRKQRVVE